MTSVLSWLFKKYFSFFSLFFTDDFLLRFHSVTSLGHQPCYEIFTLCCIWGNPKWFFCLGSFSGDSSFFCSSMGLAAVEQLHWALTKVFTSKLLPLLHVRLLLCGNKAMDLAVAIFECCGRSFLGNSPSLSAHSVVTKL